MKTEEEQHGEAIRNVRRCVDEALAHSHEAIRTAPKNHKAFLVRCHGTLRAADAAWEGSAVLNGQMEEEE